MTCYRCFSIFSCLLMILAGCATKALPPTAQESSEAASTPAPQLTSPAARVNYYRGLVSVPGITVDRKLDDGAAKHARYVLENRSGPVDFTWLDGRLRQYQPGQGIHEEDKNNAWYTPQGAAVAETCDVFQTTNIPANGGIIIDQFMTTPFLALSTLDFSQSLIGYGQDCKDGECIAVASIEMRLTPMQEDVYFQKDENSREVKFVDEDKGRLWFKTPLEFPPPGSDLQALPLGDFGYLDAITACPGYAHPAGSPILLSLGRGFGTSAAVYLSDHSLSDGGEPVEHCAFDVTGYSNPDANQQKVFRDGMLETLGVVMIPRKPLVPGHTYDVSMTVESKTYKWSFKAAASDGAK